MSNNRRLFGFGILTGAAIGYWLNTDKGKAFRKDVATMVGEYSDEISALAKDNALKLGSNFSTAMEDGQTWVSGAKGKLKTSIHELADTVRRAGARWKLHDLSVKLFFPDTSPDGAGRHPG